MTEIRTLADLYFHAIEHHSKPVAFRTKRHGVYEDVSTAEFGRIGAEISLGLSSLSMGHGDRVAILSETRLEWAEADMGMITAGIVSVPIYPTLTSEIVEYILQDSGSRALFASNQEQAAKARVFAEKNPDFRIIVFDEPDRVEGALNLEELREKGREQASADPDLRRRQAMGIQPQDLATIIYTSGTTGQPKGAMLTHRNLTSNVLASLQTLSIGESDTCLSFLPLSHVLERMAGLYTMMYAGATIAYAESVETVPQNMLEVRPTVMISVPRLYEKIYARVQDAATQGGPLKKNLFFWAKNVGVEHTRRVLAGEKVGPMLAAQYRCAKGLVFKKLKQRTGGRLRFFVSGGAPLAREIAEFFHAAGLPILEGYGLTETSPVLSVNTFEHLRLGTVGMPIPGVEIKIAEDGEILARGPNVMTGYHNNPEATAEVLRDGWFYTGDIGHLDPDGFLVITDRKKDLIVTAGGKNVAPQPIENSLKTDKYITEAMVIGDRRPYLVALIVPSFENLEEYAKFKGISVSGPGELVQHPRIRDLLRRRIERHQQDAAPYEQIKKFHILDRDLGIGEGELTPTLKVRRKEVSEHFQSEIEALYGA